MKKTNKNVKKMENYNKYLIYDLFSILSNFGTNRMKKKYTLNIVYGRIN